MIKIKQLIKSISNQVKNPFVSKHIPFGKLDSKVKIINEPFDKGNIIDIVERIKKQKQIFLNNIIKKHRSLESFLNDPNINPTPELSPKKRLPKDKPIIFTIEGLPVKSQNPLKTNTMLPDLAEIAYLIHFEELAKIINKFFKVDFKFKLIVEVNMFGKLFKINKKTTNNFSKKLNNFSKNIVRNKCVELIDWENKLKKLDGFDKAMNAQRNKLNKLVEKNDKQIIKEVMLIFPTIYMSIKPKGNVNNIFINFENINSEIKDHAKTALNVTLNIMAFNKARKICNERKKLFKGIFRGTLTPAKNKWAFFPIGPWNKLYPHHGVGLFDSKNNKVEVHYVSNIKKNTSENGRLTWIHELKS